MKPGRTRNFSLALGAAIVPAAPAATAIYATSPPAFHLDVKASGTVLAPLPGTVNPWGLACDPETGRIYFSDPTGGQIASFDPASPSTVAPLISRSGACFHGIAIDSPNRRLFFLDSANNSVGVIRLDTLAEETILVEDGITRPNDITWDATRGWIFFTDSGKDFVGVIRSWAPEGTINVEGFPAADPWGIAVHPQTGVVYFTSFSGGTVQTLDPVSGVIATVATGLSGPRGLRFDAYGRLFCLESRLDRIVQVPLPGQAVTVPTYTSAENGRAFLIFESDDLDGDYLTDAWERRYQATLEGLSAKSDPDQDGRSALDELLFNGSPAGADAPPARTFSISGGVVTTTFQGPRNGYKFGAMLSSNLSTWQTFTGSLTKTDLPDPLFSTYTLSFSPATLGLNPARTFVRFNGDRTTP